MAVIAMHAVPMSEAPTIARRSRISDLFEPRRSRRSTRGDSRLTSVPTFGIAALRTRNASPAAARNKPMPRWLPAALIGGALAALALAERSRPLRARVEPGWGRPARNATVGALTAVEIAAVERPIVRRVLAHTARRRWGLLPRLHLPRWLETVAAVVLL